MESIIPINAPHNKNCAVSCAERAQRRRRYLCKPRLLVFHDHSSSVQYDMSSLRLSVSDEAEGEGKGGKEVVETQDAVDVRECVQNGVMGEEEDEGGEDDSELDGEEEVLYDTSSHEQLESSSGSGDSERTWEEK